MLRRITLIVLVCILVFQGVAMSANEAGDGAPPTIYQEILHRGEPSSWKQPNLNPPTFRWPVARKTDTYDVQYSTDPDFAGATIVKDIELTFYRPARPLPAGDYYWRYRTTGGAWSEPLAFSIPESLPRGITLEWAHVLERIPPAHPRLWVRPETVDELVRQAQTGLKRTVLIQWKSRALRFVGEPLALDSDKERRVSTDYNERIGQSQAALADSRQTMEPAGELAFLYLLTGDEVLAGEAIRRVMAATELDPDGYTSLRVNDLANAEIVRNAAMVYDYLYDLLSQEQKAAIRDMLSARLSRIFESYRPGLEQQLYRSHAWQHIMSDFLAGSLALYGETPEATRWLDWAVRMFVAFYPWWGSVDGSSGGSASYAMGPGLLHWSHLTAELIKAATGVDIMDHPWFEANPYYIIYAHPPNGWRSQFGDYRGQYKPSSQLNILMLRYAMRFQNRFAFMYANSVTGTPNTIESYMLYFLTPLGNYPPPRSLGELPKARAFWDLGAVFMHSDITNALNNIMFEFKSSPLGSFGHGHADQNSFNIIAFNEILALDSGYYIGYGDTHHLGWTVTTAAHNGMLIDGQGQPSRNMNAYGFLTEFFTGSAFHYTVGSAATAYPGAGVERFLRHVLWIEPNVYIVYDQIDTGRPTDTQWLLHSLEPMEIDPVHRSVYVRRGAAKLSAYFAYPEAATMEQTSQFAVPVPEQPLTGKASDYPDQWHFSAHSPAKTDRHRWLTALFVTKRIEEPPAARRIAGDDWYGVQWDRAGTAVSVGFSDTAAPVLLHLGELSARAKAAAAKLTPSRGWALFASDCLEVFFQGIRAIASDVPISVELTLSGKQVQIQYQADTDINVRIGYFGKPGSVNLDGKEVEFAWDESSNELILALPSGNHVLHL